MIRSPSVMLLAASFILLPFGRLAELPMALSALGGLILLLRGRVDLQRWDMRAAVAVFAGYWLPELCSAFDSASIARSWQEVALDLRYLPMLWFWVMGLRAPEPRAEVRVVIGVLIGFWILDGLVQSATGWSLGGALSADRLSGVFGAEDLKLGPMMAVLSPFFLMLLRGRPWAIVLVGVTALLVVLLLAGTRAAWVMLLVASVVLYLPMLGARRTAAAAAAILLGMALLGSLAYRFSAPFAARIERSLQAFGGDQDGLDHALAGRLAIWGTAGRMIEQHPLNGVGVRGFRFAYAEHADADDPWIDFQQEGGAAHAHQIVLEILAETGSIGLLIWLVTLGWLLRSSAHRQGGDYAAHAAIAAMLFPLNTHYAIYSSAWGGLLLGLAALWLSQRRDLRTAED